MPLEPQTGPWYDRLATTQAGYYYPWRSTVPKRHGEDVYLEMVREWLRPDVDVLDVACGHGEVALEIAPMARSVLGYDRTRPWIDLAARAAETRGLTNATFLCHDSSAAANGGHPRIPAPDAAVDLLICSKGPFHWIEDARRAARPGATLLMLVPDATPSTPWYELLPESLRWFVSPDPHWARDSIERRLAAAGLTLHTWRSFDVPEVFLDPEQLYAWRAWGLAPGEAPSFEEIRSLLERIFAQYGGPGGLEVRRRRHIWEARIPG